MTAHLFSFCSNLISRISRWFRNLLPLIRVLCCLGVIASQHGCKSNPIESPPKNPREYRWTIDTLSYPGSYQTLMRSIWGSSCRDVYVAGHNDGAYGKAYHFDGNSWSPIKLHTVEGGPFPNIGTFEDIWGWSSNDVCIVGDKSGTGSDYVGFAIRFDGKQWRELTLPTTNELTSVWGESADDFWIGGMYGALYHFNGSSWQRDTVMNTVVSSQQYSLVRRIAGRSSTLFALLGVAYPRGEFRWYLLEHAQSRWALIDSLRGYTWFDLWMSRSGKLYRAVTGVEVREGNAWTVLVNSAQVWGCLERATRTSLLLVFLTPISQMELSTTSTDQTGTALTLRGFQECSTRMFGQREAKYL